MGILQKKRLVNRAEWRHSGVMSILAVAALLLMIPTTRAIPALYHNLERNQQPCSDCHTMHYSEGGTKPALTVFDKPGFVETEGPYAMLLMRSTTNGLCLFCHNGSVPQAPDVINAVSMYDGSGDEHSGAGFFANEGGTASDKGHDLGVNTSSVKFSSMTNVKLTCASCHDPHGTPNYRNILTAPAGGAGVTVVMQKDVYRNVPPGDPPSSSAAQAAYKRSNLGYKLNTSKWCAECHDQLKDHVGHGNNPQARKHHRGDVAINGFSSLDPPLDPDGWFAGTIGSGTGFGESTEVTGGTAGVPRLRFQVYSSSGVTDWGTARTVATNNEVMCGTCHLAHGGKYKAGLVWPQLDSGSPTDKDSGCQQCHNP